MHPQSTATQSLKVGQLFLKGMPGPNFKFAWFHAEISLYMLVSQNTDFKELAAR